MAEFESVLARPSISLAMATANSSATSFQIPTRLPLWRVIQATTPSIMSLETQSMASGSSARKRRKTVLATTRGGLRRLGSVHE